jgi:hypothetical protein
MMSFWSNTLDWLSGDGDFETVKNSVTPFGRGVANLAGSYFLSKSGFANSDAPQTGYQGGIPRYTAVRERVADTYDPNRRPGSSGQRYFTDTQYVDPYAPIETAVANDVSGDTVAEADAATDTTATDTTDTTATEVSTDPTEEGLAALDIVRQIAGKQAEYLKGQNVANPAMQANPTPLQFAAKPTGDTSPIVSRAPATVIQNLPVEQQTQGLAGFVPQYAQGGIANLSGGRYLDGATDGMADKVPANIDGQQPAALSDGEFVVPADVVSHLGNGNSNAGVMQLYAMMDNVRKARTGNPKQGKQINPAQYMPGMRA